MMTGEGKTVCVTGASGYIASWIVKLLLQRGYIVRVSVTNLSLRIQRKRHLASLDGAKERLHFFEANLLEEGSFDSLVNGCECVFHTASPVIFFPTDPQTELIEPAVNGTLNVLRSCKKSHSINRVVLTSSLASVGFSKKGLTPKSGIDIDETWFSDAVFCEESKAWYILSKTLAEEAAWKFAKENGIDLVTTNAGYVIGPLLQPTLNFTVEMILNLINGKSKTFPNMFYHCVDVRDAAIAHILAFEVQSASGRYCLVGHYHHYAHILNIIRKLYPSLDVAEKCEDEEHIIKWQGVSKEKAERLGIKFTPLEVTLRDTIESLKDKGFLKI